MDENHDDPGAYPGNDSDPEEWAKVVEQWTGKALRKQTTEAYHGQPAQRVPQAAQHH